MGTCELPPSCGGCSRRGAGIWFWPHHGPTVTRAVPLLILFPTCTVEMTQNLYLLRTL